MHPKAGVVVLTSMGGAARELSEKFPHLSSPGGDLIEQLTTRDLKRITMLLKENGALLQELQSEIFLESGRGILDSYLLKVRRDGVAKHAEMKQRVDAVTENNTAIVTLVSSYMPYARDERFRSEADKFFKYAATWRDRWNSMMPVFMSGGTYAASDIPFPNGFLRAAEEALPPQNLK